MVAKKISAVKKNKIVKKNITKNISKYSFLSWISHELRSPISSINAAASLLSMPEMLSEDEKKEYIDSIIDACQNSNKFTDDLLEIMGIESGIFEIEELTEENIKDLFARSIKLIKGKAVRNSIMIKTKIAENCTKIKCDSRRFKQILVNLLLNSINHSKDRTVINISAKKLKGDKIQISVKDQGAGMSKEKIKKSLQKIKINKNTFNEVDPLELKLPIIKHLIEKHHGTLEIKSKVGAGSEFIIIIPS